MDIQVIDAKSSQAAAISHLGMAAGLFNPMLSQLISQRPTLENKHQGGWKVFAKKWQHYSELLSACNGDCQRPETLLLERFKGSLDLSDQKLLEIRREQNPKLTLDEFWEELQNLYDKDTPAQNRQAWESIKPPPGELSLDKWLEFLREFQLLRDRVEDRTAHEEYQLLMRCLPHSWQKQLIKEEAKRAKGQLAVRITNMPPRTPRDAKHELETLTDMDLIKVSSIPNGITVWCSSLECQKAVLDLGGSSWVGFTIKCTRVEPTLSGEETSEFVTERLLTEQKFQNFKNTGQ